jgi:carotenoid cleavage dioxygenase-like enzyme
MHAGIEVFASSHCYNRKGSTIMYNLEVKVPIPGLKNDNVAHIVKIDGSLKRKVIGSVSIGDKLPFIHDICVTENYAVLCIWPAFFNGLTELVNGEGMMSKLQWDPSKKTEMYVFDLQHFDPTKNAYDNAYRGPAEPIAHFRAPPVFAYHFVNGFEEANEKGNKEIVFDLVAYDNANIANGKHAFAYLDNVLDKVCGYPCFDAKHSCTNADDNRYLIPTKT